MEINRMKARMAAIVVAIVLATVAIVPVASATGNDGSGVTVYEYGANSVNPNLHGDNHTFLKADGSVPNLTQRTDGLFLGCDGGQTWNDCISGVMIAIGDGTCVRFYQNINYGGIMYVMFKRQGAGISVGTQSWTGLARDNQVSSIQWGDWEATGFGDYFCNPAGY